jgi:hypothetical protein
LGPKAQAGSAAPQALQFVIVYVLSHAGTGSLQSAAVDDLPIANQDGTGAPNPVQLNRWSAWRQRISNPLSGRVGSELES